MSDVFDKVKAVELDLTRVLLEREGAIRNALLALLTRQHYLQISREPGTAKTMLAKAVQARITGARYFECCFFPGTTADELLGPVDLLAYADQGKRQRVYRRSLAEADLGFIDEIGRGNDLVYPVLLPLLGDQRTVNELGLDAPLTIPLVSLFAASNSHLSGNEKLEALNNRFLLREEILPVQDRASLIALATNPPQLGDIRATMRLDDLRAAQAEAQTVQGTAEMLEAALDLREQLLRDGVVITGRMWTWSFPLIKAHAWLHGAPETTLEDLGVLASAWWQDPKDRGVVQRTIYAIANPLDSQALEIEDDALDLLKQLPENDERDWLTQAESTNVQLQDMLTTLMRAIKGSKARDKSRAIASLKKIHTAQTGLAQTFAKRMNLGTIDVSGVLVP